MEEQILEKYKDPSTGRNYVIIRSSEFAIRWCQVLGFAIPFYDGGSHGNKFFFSGKYSVFFGKARKKRVFSALQMLIFLAGGLQICQN